MTRLDLVDTRSYFCTCPVRACPAVVTTKKRIFLCAVVPREGGVIFHRKFADSSLDNSWLTRMLLRMLYKDSHSVPIGRAKRIRLRTVDFGRPLFSGVDSVFSLVVEGGSHIPDDIDFRWKFERKEVC